MKGTDVGKLDECMEGSFDPYADIFEGKIFMKNMGMSILPALGKNLSEENGMQQSFFVKEPCGIL